ncbi:MAG TPA: sugar ABC transporter permease [bacterium (Candidatus Stahlbacteria)]|nr:sugar ABC transporter permease [Candidatus Stahlbacteria bacterium]
MIPYLLIVPVIVYLSIFLFVPLTSAIGLAFEEGNLIRALTDSRFWDSLCNTLLLTAATVPLQILTAFLIAYLLRTRLRRSGFYLYLFSIPIGISDLAAGLVMFSIFTHHGWLNSFLYQLNIIQSPIPFISYERSGLVFWAIVIAEHWRATAIVLIILTAGLEMISKELIDAAEIFGASTFQKLRFVIIPLLRPSIQSALIIRTIFALQMFGVVLALSGEIIPVLAGESYFWFQIYRNRNIASVYALTLMFISLIMTWVYIRLLRVRR